MNDPRKLADIDNAEALRLLREHEPLTVKSAICGCDRCIVLRGLLRDREAAKAMPRWDDNAR